MRNAWHKIRNGFLSYSRGDRVGIIILSVLIIIVLVLKMILGRVEPTPVLSQYQFDEILNDWHKEKNQVAVRKQEFLFPFDPNIVTESELDSFALPAQIKRNLIKYRAAGGNFKSKADVRKLYGMTDSIFESIEPFIEIPAPPSKKEETKVDRTVNKKPEGTFDPNTASAALLKSYGLNDFQANNIVAYRESGGSFGTAEDLLKIYGLDSTKFNELSSFINIEKGSVAEPGKPGTNNEGLYIEINSADTADLMLVHGIGRVYASRIIKYRDLLGGFYSINQLTEVYGFTDDLCLNVEPYFYVDTMAIRKIRINYAEFAEMIRHPYFDRPTVNAILTEKDKNGPIKNIADLTHMEAFDNEFVEKIRPYITCR